MSRCSLMLVSGLVLSRLLTAAEPGVKAQFIGGTLPDLPAKADGRIDLTGADALAVHCRGAELRISYQRINTLEYGQTVSRRYAAAILISPVLLLSKSRKHYVTVGYLDSEGAQQALVFRV